MTDGIDDVDRLADEMEAMMFAYQHLIKAKVALQYGGPVELAEQATELSEQLYTEIEMAKEEDDG